MNNVFLEKERKKTYLKCESMRQRDREKADRRKTQEILTLTMIRTQAATVVTRAPTAICQKS